MRAIEVIKGIEAEITLKRQRISDIRNSCQHKWEPSNPRDLTCSYAVCRECGSGKDGWWCEGSPTNECDYSRPSGRGYNPDCCRYCHQPEERK